MALVIEDGTGVLGATSYATDTQLTDYATARSYEVPAVEADRDVLMIKAMDFLESLRYYGTKVEIDQSLSYPRDLVYIDGELFPNDEIPVKLIRAQCALAVVANSIDLMPNFSAGSKGIVLSESVFGAVSRSYAASTVSQRAPYLPYINSLLSQICDWVPGSGLGRMISVRA